MIINKEQLELLQGYRDKAYVSAVLCEKTSSYYSLFRNIISVPLIITSSVMSIINSTDIPSNELKIVNIIFNAITAFTLAINNNFKFTEKASIFKNNNIKFTKLLHQIEDNLINDKNNLTTEKIREYISIYDGLYENLEFNFPNHIKDKVRNIYKDKKTLPNILNCETPIITNDTIVFTNNV